MHRLPTLTALLVAGLVSLAPPAVAIEDLLSPRSIGVGGALRADATGALGPLMNPAAMPMHRSYSIEAMYGIRVQDVGHTLNLAIVDSITSRVAAGIYYSYVHSTPKLYLAPLTGSESVAVEGAREGHETGLALALPLGEMFSFGVTTKYITVATVAPNPEFDPNDAVPLPEQLTLDSTVSDSSANGFTMDFGIALTLRNTFSLAVIGYNLVPLRSVEAPMSLGAGLAFRPRPSVTLAFDTVVYFDKYHHNSLSAEAGERITSVRLGGGLEWLIAGKVPLRLGAMWDSGRPATYLSMGLAYVGQKFAIDAAYRQQVAGGVESMIVTGLRVFLQ